VQMANEKEKKDANETELQHKLKEQMIDGVFGQISSVIKDGSELKLHLDVDRKTGELSMELSLAGKPGTKLAASFADLNKATSLFAGMLRPDAAFNVLAHAALPQNARQVIVPALEEGIRRELSKEKDAAKRKHAAGAVAVLM